MYGLLPYEKIKKIMSEQKKTYNQTRLWKSILNYASIYSFTIAILLSINYFQINRADPINTKVIPALVERLNQNPADETLRNEIREFDLLVRKAYFTNQWQLRFGSYLLLTGILVCVIAILMLDSSKNKFNPITDNADKRLFHIQKKARKWITIGGVALTGVALILAYLTHKQIGSKFNATTSTNNTIDTESIQTYSNSFTQIDTVTIDNDTTISGTQKENILISLAYPTDAMKSNFPSFRGAGGNGIVYQKNYPTSWDGASGKQIKWKTSIPLPGFNSPIVWGNRVFLAGANNSKQEIYCFNTKNGKLLWAAEVKKINGAPEKSPKVTDDTGYSAPSLTTDGVLVFAIFANGNIVAFDMNGKKVWGRNLGLPENHYGHSSSLYIVDNKLIIQYDQKKSAAIMALDITTGNTLWSTPRSVKISWASPVIVNTGKRIEILLIADPYVASYDPSTGKELWKIKCTSGEVGPSVSYANGLVFALNDYAKLVAIKLGLEPSILWESTDYLSDVPSPIATENFLIIATSFGEIACYNPKTGDLYWTHNFEVGSYSSPMLVGDQVYFLDKNGTMHIFKLNKEFILVSEPKLGEKTFCTPAFANQYIYIRAGNKLYCIGK